MTRRPLEFPHGPSPTARLVALAAGALLLVSVLAFPAPARGVQLNLQYFGQCDSQWGSNALGTCALTMCSDGCAVTSSAMVYQYYGGTMSPGELNTCLTSSGGYANGCLIIWGNSCLPSGVSYVGQSGDIDAELGAGRPVIAHVSNASISMHFVVIVGNDGGQYQILDPYYPGYQTLADGSYAIQSIRIYHGNSVDPCDVVVTSQGETVIDDTNACFVRHGGYWWTSTTGHGGSHQYTYAVDEASPDCWAEWRFEVQDAGSYEVQVFIPDQDADSQAARYTVDTGTGESDVIIDQLAASDWTSLGTFEFAAGEDRSVSLFDNTGELLSSHIPVGFDAVKLVPTSVDPVDGGIVGPDGALGPDGGPGADGAAAADGGVEGDAAAPEPPGENGGCQCRAAGSSSEDAAGCAALLILLLGFFWLGAAGRGRRRSP